MSQPIVVTFTPSNATQIASAQTGVANVPLTLNNTDISGNSVSVNRVNIGSQMAVLPGFQRKITVTSNGNDSGITFAIVGTNVSSQPVTESLAGANAGVATSTNAYNKIYSITPSGNTANTVTAGTSTTGTSKWIKLDANRDNPALAVIQAVVITGNNASCTYTVNGTASRVEDNFTGQPVTPTVFANPISASFTNANTSVVGNEVLNYQAINISVTASSNGGGVTLTVLQPGV